MISEVLPPAATHSFLDLFEKPPLLIAFTDAFEQRVGCLYSPNGPTIEFNVIGDSNNFIDLTKIYLEITCCIQKGAGVALEHGGGTDDEPIFLNNTLHSLFSDCDIYLNGTKVSSCRRL